MKVKKLIYCYRGAAEAGEIRHAQEVVRDIGVTYQHCTPQSMADQWWFWIPSNLPDTLPDYMTIKEVDPMESIGWGLSEKTAILLRDCKETSSEY